MDRLVTFFGRLARRQDGALDLPLDVDLPIGGSLSSSTGRSSTTSAASSTSLASTTTSAASTTTTASIPPSSQTPSLSSSATTQTPLTTSSTGPSVILVQTTADSVPSNTVASLPAAQTSVVFESKTVIRSGAPSASGLPDKSGAAAKSNFLENKVASGIVFGLCGLVGLLLILLIVWFAMRKRLRIKKLEKEIISFDPEDVGHFHQRKDVETGSITSVEKGRSASSLDHYAGNGYAPTMHTNNVDYNHRNAGPLTDFNPPHIAVQRPRNAAFNPTSNSDLNYSRSLKKPVNYAR